MDKIMEKNAIILAAGKSNTFAPFTYEKPKGLFKVRGEILIERQIEQLNEAGVFDIYVVVGYMKEKFFYLETKYKNVHIIVNNRFGHRGNINSLYVARNYLSNSFICCADQYFYGNPFMDANEDNISYRHVSFLNGKFKKFSVSITDANVITDFSIGGDNHLAMVGLAYFNENFSLKFKELIEKEINNFGIISLFWEEFYAKHVRELTLFGKKIEKKDDVEFESIDDLRQFDSDFLINVDSNIVNNICQTLDCQPNDITNIAVINAGLTNVSFSFEVHSIKYVYRHPGGTAGNLTNRRAELFSQMAAKEVGIDKSVIKLDLSGWKISYFVEDAKNCDFEKYPEQLITAMDYLHKLHKVSSDGSVKVFDNFEEGKKLMTIASSTKGNLFKEFAPYLEKIEKLYSIIKEDAKRLGYGLVLCHNDVYEPNYLYDNKGEIYLIDWEYAGMNYAANDICCITCRYNWTEEQIDKYFEVYFGRKLTSDESRFYWAFHVLCGFYWFCWGLYKGSVGDDDGFFFLPAYKNMAKYIDRVLKSYEVEE